MLRAAWHAQINRSVMCKSNLVVPPQKRALGCKAPGSLASKLQCCLKPYFQGTAKNPAYLHIPAHSPHQFLLAWGWRDRRCLPMPPRCVSSGLTTYLTHFPNGLLLHDGAAHLMISCKHCSTLFFGYQATNHSEVQAAVLPRHISPAIHCGSSGAGSKTRQHILLPQLQPPKFHGSSGMCLRELVGHSAAHLASTAKPELPCTSVVLMSTGI